MPPIVPASDTHPGANYSRYPLEARCTCPLWSQTEWWPQTVPPKSATDGMFQRMLIKDDPSSCGVVHGWSPQGVICGPPPPRVSSMDLFPPPPRLSTDSPIPLDFNPRTSPPPPGLLTAGSPLSPDYHPQTPPPPPPPTPGLSSKVLPP